MRKIIALYWVPLAHQRAFKHVWLTEAAHVQLVWSLQPTLEDYSKYSSRIVDGLDDESSPYLITIMNQSCPFPTASHEHGLNSSTIICSDILSICRWDTNTIPAIRDNGDCHSTSSPQQLHRIRMVIRYSNEGSVGGDENRNVDDENDSDGTIGGSMDSSSTVSLYKCSWFDAFLQRWSSSGCVTRKLSPSRTLNSQETTFSAVECECNHITEFAVQLYRIQQQQGARIDGESLDDTNKNSILQQQDFADIMLMVMYTCIVLLLVHVTIETRRAMKASSPLMVTKKSTSSKKQKTIMLVSSLVAIMSSFHVLQIVWERVNTATSNRHFRNQPSLIQRIADAIVIQTRFLQFSYITTRVLSVAQEIPGEISKGKGIHFQKFLSRGKHIIFLCNLLVMPAAMALVVQTWLVEASYLMAALCMVTPVVFVYFTVQTTAILRSINSSSNTELSYEGAIHFLIVVTRIYAVAHWVQGALYWSSVRSMHWFHSNRVLIVLAFNIADWCLLVATLLYLKRVISSLKKQNAAMKPNKVGELGNTQWYHPNVLPNAAAPPPVFEHVLNGTKIPMTMEEQARFAEEASENRYCGTFNESNVSNTAAFQAAIPDMGLYYEAPQSSQPE